MDGSRDFRFQGNDLRLDSSTAAVVVGGVAAALISYGYLKVESGFERVKSRRRGKVATHFLIAGATGVLDLKSSVSELINTGSKLFEITHFASMGDANGKGMHARAHALVPL